MFLSSRIVLRRWSRTLINPLRKDASRELSCRHRFGKFGHIAPINRVGRSTRYLTSEGTAITLIYVLLIAILQIKITIRVTYSGVGRV